MALFPLTGSTIKGRVLASFPASVEGEGGVEVVKINGVWTIRPKWEDLDLIDSDTDITDKQVWTYDDATGVYNRVRLPLVFAGAVRHDEVQSLSEAQALQARKNIFAARVLEVDVRDFGVYGDTDNDYGTELAAAIAQIETAGFASKTLLFPAGDFYTSSVLTLSKLGMRIKGVGMQTTANYGAGGEEGTRIIADHTFGPVVRVKGSFSGISDLTIDATSAREGGSATGNFGIHEEPEDIVNIQTNGCFYENVRVTNQPGDAVALVGLHMDNRVVNCQIDGNGGHGVIIDNGMLTGRTNRSRPGAVKISGTRIFDNIGHSIVAGNSDEVNNFVYRLRLENNDIYRNAYTAGVRRNAHSLWLHCETSLIHDNGIAGSKADNTAEIPGIYLIGRGVFLINNRYPSVLNNAIVIDRNDNLISNGIVVDGLDVSSVPSSLNPAVSVIGASVSRIFVRAANTGSITSLLTAGIPNSQQQFGGEAIWEGSLELPNTGLRLRDTNASHYLTVAPGSNLSANRTLTITTGDADRTLDISAGSVTVTAAGADLLDDATAADQRTTLGVGAGDSPQFTAINLGHASDTTLARTGAGDFSVEGNAVYRAGGADVPVADGGTGASTAIAAAANLKVPYVLGASAAALSHTGDTVETTQATITIPANAMGANGIVRVTTLWSHTNSSNNKTLRVRFGGVVQTNTVVTTTATTRTQAQVANRNATNSQVGFTAGTGQWGSTTTAVSTSAIDTTAAVNITITALLADVGEIITLEYYLVELLVP